ncbi:MAG: GNAT family N-acetyltransferase [Bacteroidia bacterium]|nr:GNAT family N-acetyltransferase [Bacteroidia bacterium]
MKQTDLINIIAPEDCSKEQLDLFFNTILNGGQIKTSEELLIKNIKNCVLLAFYEIENKLAGISAVKIPRTKYKKTVFEKAKVSADEKLFEFEIGYVVTVPEFRGRGVSSILIKELIKRNPSATYFATTKSEFMPKIFKKVNFVKHGESYLNTSKEKLDLYIYNNDKTQEKSS